MVAGGALFLTKGVCFLQPRKLEHTDTGEKEREELERERERS